MQIDSDGGAIPLTNGSAVSTEPVGEIVQGILDELPVTDTVYHHLAYTRPLVDALVSAVVALPAARRILIVGPNDLLPQALVRLGYQVDLRVVSGLPLSRFNLPLVSGEGTLEAMLQTDSEVKYDAVVAPYLVEAAEADPEAVLASLSRCVRTNGHLVVACRQPGELRRRIRRLLRLARPTIAPDDPFPPSPTWPPLAARQLLTRGQVASSTGLLFHLTSSRFVIDHRAYVTTEAMGFSRWTRKSCVHLAKLLVPQFRDCFVSTLARSG